MIAKIAFATLSGDVKSSIDLVEEAASLGKSVQLLTRDLTKYFRDLIIIKHDPGCNAVLRLPTKLFDAAAEIARGFDAVVLMRALDIFSGIEAKSRYSNQPKILLETAIIKTATLSGEDLTDLRDIRLAYAHDVLQRAADDVIRREQEKDRKERGKASRKCGDTVLLEKLLQLGILLRLIVGILSLDLHLLVGECLLLHHGLRGTDVKRYGQATDDDRQENDRQTEVAEE